MTTEENIEKIKVGVFKEKKIIGELDSLLNYSSDDKQEKKMIEDYTEKLKISLKKTNEELLKILGETDMSRSLEEVPLPKTKEKEITKKAEKKVEKKAEKRDMIFGKKSEGDLSEMEREIIKRLKKKNEKKKEIKEKKPSAYAQTANNLFGNFVRNIIRQKKLLSLEKDLIRSNLNYTSITYFSILVFTTIISAAVAFILFIFFLFFNLGPDLPIVTRATEGFFLRLVKVIWLIFLIPAGTFLFMYFYPSLEKKTVERKIEQELPFAAIHMAAISGSMIEPTRIFSIISATKEYPHIERELNKLLNEINVYGYDLVTALKDCGANSPSTKLAELFNGLATTITSGGDLFDFFDKRSQTLLFDYRLEKEKRTKTSETFMDIYISVVIAAPMILMLLLMMMKISGLGVALSTTMITFLVSGGVALINVFFLVFLQLKQPEAL